MPCCHIPSKARPVFPPSLVTDAERFSLYVGAGNPVTPSVQATVLTSALHLEMKLWPPFGRLPHPPHNANHARNNSWTAMRLPYGINTFTRTERAVIFHGLNPLRGSRSCCLEEDDAWLMHQIIQQRKDGIQPHRNPVLSIAGNPTTLASLGRSQKLVNVFVKYELCCQVSGQWLAGAFNPGDLPWMPDLPQFLCALHAPIDSIVLRAIERLPLGSWLKKQTFQHANGNLWQSSTGTFVPWSKLDSLRTYYGLQLILRRIAMQTWSQGCACAQTAETAITECADWFEREYGESEARIEKDWIQAARSIPVATIRDTIEKLRSIQTLGSGDIEKWEELNEAHVGIAPGNLGCPDILTDPDFVGLTLDPADKDRMRKKPPSSEELAGIIIKQLNSPQGRGSAINKVIFEQWNRREYWLEVVLRDEKEGYDAKGVFNVAAKAIAISAGSTLTINPKAKPAQNIKQNYATVNNLLEKGLVQTLSGGFSLAGIEV